MILYVTNTIRRIASNKKFKIKINIIIILLIITTISDEILIDNQINENYWATFGLNNSFVIRDRDLVLYNRSVKRESTVAGYE